MDTALCNQREPFIINKERIFQQGIKEIFMLNQSRFIFLIRTLSQHANSPPTCLFVNLCFILILLFFFTFPDGSRGRAAYLEREERYVLDDEWKIWLWCVLNYCWLPTVKIIWMAVFSIEWHNSIPQYLGCKELKYTTEIFS